MKAFDYCEYHIDLGKLKMGVFHVLSEDRVSDEMIENLTYAVKCLSFQYGGHGLKCVEYVECSKALEGEDVLLVPTDSDIYLLNISDYLKYCRKSATDSSQIYIMSHDLYLRFRERVQSKDRDNIFEALIQEVYEREGLLYGIIEVRQPSESGEVDVTF